MNEREAYSVAEVAERYGLHRATIYREIGEGRLDARRVRGRTVIFRDAVSAWRSALPKCGVGESVGKP